MNGNNKKYTYIMTYCYNSKLSLSFPIVQEAFNIDKLKHYNSGSVPESLTETRQKREKWQF